MNTSDRVLGPLSEIVRRVCDEAIRSAQREGRRTVLDRDIPESKRDLSRFVRGQRLPWWAPPSAFAHPTVRNQPPWLQRCRVASHRLGRAR